MNSVVDKVSQLRWPVLWCVFLGVVPPFLRVPFVELDQARCLPEGKGLTTSEHDRGEEPVADVLSEFAAILSATNNESDESPESENPGGWNEPGDDSVVELLHDALVDVGEEPEECCEAEEDAICDFQDVPGVLFSLGPPIVPAIAPLIASPPWSDCGFEDRVDDGQEEPDETDADGGCTVVLIKEIGILCVSSRVVLCKQNIHIN